jgi:creatinine amidohydrolase
MSAMTRGFCAAVTVVLCYLAAQPDPMTPDPNAPRPIAGIDSVFTEDLTWMEIRDALREGKDTVIVATGGVEQNGPYLATGKHNLILRGTTEAIARKLKTALVAPIIPFVPEGDIDPPSGHMHYPGSISVTEETFQRLLTDICRSMRANGFKHIVLIGDSGGNQNGMKAVSETLTRQWDTQKSKVYYIPEYYNYGDVATWLQQQGIHEDPEGLHDDFAISALMIAVAPNGARTKQRLAAGNFRINGIDLAPVEKTAEWGRKIIDFRAEATVKAIRAAMSR